MTSKTALLVPDDDEEKALAESWEDYAGEEWEDDGTADIPPSFPIVKIVQAVSTMDDASKHVGEFWHSDTEMFTPELQAVMLMVSDTRAYFEEGAAEPVCISPDGEKPLPNQPLWEGQDQPATCAACPFSAWDEEERRYPCKLSKVVLLDREHDGLARLRISGKSIKPFKQFVARKMKPKRRPMFSFLVNLRTEERKADGRKWFELAIDVVRDLTPSEARPYNEAVKEKREEFARSLAAVEQANTGNGDDWPDDLPEQEAGWESEAST